MRAEKLTKLCAEILPNYTEEYIPDLVFDFIWDMWEELKEVMD